MVGLWKGADFQEREIFDLFGISFIGHPNLNGFFFGMDSRATPAKGLQTIMALKTETFMLNAGPQHPSTHGCFACV